MLIQQLSAVIQKEYDDKGQDAPAKRFTQIYQMHFSRKQEVVVVKVVGSKKRNGR